MARRPRRSPEGRSERSREKKPVHPSIESKPSAPHAGTVEIAHPAKNEVAAIGAAREHAIAHAEHGAEHGTGHAGDHGEGHGEGHHDEHHGHEEKEEKEEEVTGLLGLAKRGGRRAKKYGKMGLQLMGGALVVATYLGYKTSRPLLLTAASALDWIGQKMNKWADKLIDKKIPVLSWILNPTVSILDAAAKKLGLDKTVLEHLKKDAEDRKKLAEKLAHDFHGAEKKYEKKMDDASKKKARHSKLKEVLGADVADAIINEVDDAEKSIAEGQKESHGGDKHGGDSHGGGHDKSHGGDAHAAAPADHGGGADHGHDAHGHH